MDKNLKLADLYPTRFLEAVDLKGQKVTVMIADVNIETLDTVTLVNGKAAVVKKDTPIVTLADPKTREPKKKQWRINVTNKFALALLLGIDVQEWQWKRVVLFADEDFEPSGEEVIAIRIESSPDATPERAKAYADAWRGKRKRGALGRKLKRALSLIEHKKGSAKEEISMAGEEPSTENSETDKPNGVISDIAAEEQIVGGDT